MLKTTPAVFAVGNDYQIMVETENEALLSVKVGNEIYYDESNGIMNSLSPIHRVTVPISALDKAKEYIVCILPIIERKPYFTETEKQIEYTFKFKPVPKNDVRIYHLADTHNRIEEPVNAAKAFGDIDILILNGDIIDHSGNPQKFANIYEICAKITNGSFPVVFSRGNHDMRGNFAEKFADFTPSQNKNTYYTFRIGSVWGIVLDCGEDKDDSHCEYGFTVACHTFRKRQTKFIKSVIDNAKEEYEHQDVKTKLVISHIPFTMQFEPPFNIEKEIYSEWASLLRDNIKPDLMLCGHTHKCVIIKPNKENDCFDIGCPLVIGSEPTQEGFIGCGLILKENEIEVVFTDSQGNTISSEILKHFE